MTTPTDSFLTMFGRLATMVAGLGPTKSVSIDMNQKVSERSATLRFELHYHSFPMTDYSQSGEFVPVPGPTEGAGSVAGDDDDPEDWSADDFPDGVDPGVELEDGPIKR